MSLLDTVEPDAWRYQTVRNTYRYRGVCHNFGIDYKLLKPVGLLTVPHVEFLLSQCRKEALLEAAAFIQGKADRYPDTLGSYYRINDANELRRMAESVKTTTEGEK